MRDVIDLTLSDDEGGGNNTGARRRRHEQHGRQTQQREQQCPPQLPLPVSEYRAFLQNTPSNHTTHGRVFTSFLPGSMPHAATARSANEPIAQNITSVSATDYKAGVQAHGAAASTHSAVNAAAHPGFAMVVANALGLTRTTVAAAASAATVADTQQQKRQQIITHHRPSPSEREPSSPRPPASYFGRPAGSQGQPAQPDHIYYHQSNQNQRHQQAQQHQHALQSSARLQLLKHLPFYQHKTIENLYSYHDYHNQNQNQNHSHPQPPQPSFHNSYGTSRPPSPHQSRLPPLYSLSSQQSLGSQSHSPTEVHSTPPFRFAPTAASFGHTCSARNRRPQPAPSQPTGPSSAHMSPMLVSSATSAASASASASVSASTPASFLRTGDSSGTNASVQPRTGEPSSSVHLWSSLPTRQLSAHDSLSSSGRLLPQAAFKQHSTPPQPQPQSQPPQSRFTPTDLASSRLPLLDHPSPSGQLLASQLSAGATVQPLEQSQPLQPLQPLQQTARPRRRSLSSVPSPSSQLSLAVAASPHSHTHTHMVVATPFVLSRAPLAAAPSLLGSAPKSPSSSSLSLSSLCSDSPPTPTFSHSTGGISRPRPVSADEASVDTPRPGATTLEKGLNAGSVDLAQPGMLETVPEKRPVRMPELEAQPESKEPEQPGHLGQEPETVTPKRAVAWTTAKMEVALQDLLRALHADHARLVEHTISAQKPRQQRFLSAVDDFSDMPSRNTDTAAQDKDCLKVRIRTHRENQKRAEGRVLHCGTTTLKTPNQSVPKYRFHHVEIAKNILSPNTPLKFIPHIRDLEDGSEDKKRFDQWIEELESMELKSGFDSSKRMDKWASTRVTEYAKLVSLYLDAWLAELAIDNCSKATLIRYMASGARNDEAITPKQKSSLLQSCGGDMSMSSASPRAVKAASMFTDAFNRVFRTKSITLKNVLVQDEALGANQLVLANGSTVGNATATATAVANDHDKDNYLDLIQQYLGTYSFLGCLICHAHSCEHGEFDAENVRRGFSIEDLGWKLWMHVARRRDLQAKERRQQQKLLQQQQQQQLELQQHYPQLQQQQQLQLRLPNVFVSRSCNNQCYLSYDIGDPAFGNRPWADDETNLLRSLHFAMADSNGKLQCTAASILGRACWEVYRRMKELGIQGPLPLPPRAPDPASVKPASWYDRHRKVLIGDWSDHTYTHAHALREQREPCNHDGPCTVARGCPCVESKLLCERFCRCTSDTCAYKFTGCACHGSGKSCYARQKEGRPCICVQLNRECDPVLCRGCGARERADIHNRDDTHLHATGCQNVALQRGLAKSVALGKSQLEGCGYGLFTAEDIAADEFVIEYVGELITHDEGVRREARRGDVFNQESNASYLFTLLEQDGIWVDAAIYGNLSRYINHASESDKRGCNITPKILYVNGEFRIKFTAMRDIKTGEELFFNYGENFPNLTKKLLEDKASNSEDDDTNGGNGNDGGVNGNVSGNYGHGSGDRSKTMSGDANGTGVGSGNSNKNKNGNGGNSNRSRGRAKAGSRTGAARTRRRRRTAAVTASKSKGARKEAPPIHAEMADSIDDDVMNICLDVDADDDDNDNDNDTSLPLPLQRRTVKRKRTQQEQEDKGKDDDADTATAAGSINGSGPTGSRARVTRQRTNASAVLKKGFSDHHDDGDEKDQNNVAADSECLRSGVVRRHKAATRHSSDVNSSRNGSYQEDHNGDYSGDYGGEPARKRIRIVRSGQAIRQAAAAAAAADSDAPSISSLQQEKPQKRIRIVGIETETVAAVTAVAAAAAATGIDSDESVAAPIRRRLRRLDQKSTAVDDDLASAQSTPQRERKRSSSRNGAGGSIGQQDNDLSNFHNTIDSASANPRRIVADSDEVQDDSGDGDGDGEDDDDVVDRSSRKRQKPARYRNEGL